MTDVLLKKEVKLKKKFKTRIKLRKLKDHGLEAAFKATVEVSCIGNEG